MTDYYLTLAYIHVGREEGNCLCVQVSVSLPLF